MGITGWCVGCSHAFTFKAGLRLRHKIKGRINGDGRVKQHVWWPFIICWLHMGFKTLEVLLHCQQGIGGLSSEGSLSNVCAVAYSSSSKQLDLRISCRVVGPWDQADGLPWGELQYRLSQTLPPGAALMLLAKCPVVAKALTLKISSSKQAVTTVSDDGIGFHFFVCIFSELQPWFRGTATSICIVLLEVQLLDQHEMVDKANAFAKNVFINLW